jgi:hypothetical protein
MARPTDYTPELADAICARLADGESLRTVCLSDEMPDKSTVFRWLRTNQAFCDQYTRAKEESADALTDEMLDISDDGTNDWMERKGGEGESTGWQVNGEHIQRSRLRIETRKWIASKLKPKKYGDKVDLTHAGPGGGAISTVVEVVSRGVLPPNAP